MTPDALFASLDHLQKVRAKLYAHRAISQNVRRGVRLYIPSVVRGLEVLAIHEKCSGGEVLGYDHSATLEDAEFIVQPAGARKVGAEGGNKFPFAYIGGKLMAEQAQHEGEIIYYNPRVVHLFVDGKMRPVKGAAKVYQIGKTTYAAGLKYYGPGEAPTAPVGMKSLVRAS
jgi:hypothetical protein